MSECAFCTELDNEPRVCEPFGGDRVIWEDDDFVILPTVGCFTEGYVMIMPRDHTYSIAQLEPPLLRKLGRLTAQLRGQLQRIYGLVAVAEHGALNCEVKGAQCCDHAHLHFIPVVTEEKMDQMCKEYAKACVPGNNSEFLSTVMDLGRFREYAYILFSPYPGCYNVWKSSDGFQRQFCRLAAARALGKEEEYDWRKHYGVENMRKTVERLHGNLKFNL